MISFVHEQPSPTAGTAEVSARPRAAMSRRSRYPTLRKKTAFIVVITLLGLLVIAFLPMHVFLRHSFITLEEQNISRNAERAASSLTANINQLDHTALDYASWDDTYTFVAERSSDYVSANLIDETFSNNRLNLLMILDRSGTVVYGRWFDLQSGQEMPLPERFRDEGMAQDPLLRHTTTDSSISGVMLLPQAPMLVASRPILQSDSEGPIRGTLIMGRLLDQTEVNRLAATIHSTLNIHRADATTPSAQVQQTWQELSGTRSVYARAINQNVVAGYVRYDDVYGKPALLLSTEQPRDIYLQGQRSILYFMLSLLGAGVIFGVVVLVLIERGVLSRLARLRNSVKRIGNSSQVSGRVAISGADELSDLADDINAMLDAWDQAQHRRQESDERYRVVVEHASEGIFLVEAESWRIIEANAAFQRLLGYSADELGRLTLSDLVASDAADLAQDFRSLMADGGIVLGERCYRKSDGTHLSIEASANVISSQGRQVACFVIHDLTERKRNEEERAQRRSEERFQSLVRNASDVIIITGADGVISYHSPAAERTWGFAAEVLNGLNVLELVHPDDLSRARLLFDHSLASSRKNIPSELRVKHSDGTWRNCEVIANNLLDDLEVGGIMMTYRDITERKQAEAQLSHLAFHDPLSGLPNRALFMVRLEQALLRAEYTGRRVALLFLDLDNFKVVNDSLGHQVGDQLLIAVAERLKLCLRGQDTAARLGGDEFTVLIEEVDDTNQAISVATRIISQLQAPFTFDGQEIYTATSIGIALSAPDQTDPGGLLRDADLAMYRAKSSGKSRYEIFDRSMNALILRRLELETDLRRAIERKEFVLLYQPIVNIADGHIDGAEALIRWQHPRRGLISPYEFIPIAEETGLILPIGYWVLAEACRQVRIWQTEYNRPNMMVSVNLSVRQFQHPRLVEEITHILQESQIERGTLKLEITESIMMQDTKTTVAILDRLKALGVKLALDDFGTGYSSLGYLKSLPIDTLKIDRSFVDQLGQNNGDTAIVQTITTLANTLGLSVTAEGIETVSQLAQLRGLACDQGQGYYFARPMSSDVMSSSLNEVRDWSTFLDHDDPSIADQDLAA